MGKHINRGLVTGPKPEAFVLVGGPIKGPPTPKVEDVKTDCERGDDQPLLVDEFAKAHPLLRSVFGLP